jgi:hypothetical protein
VSTTVPNDDLVLAFNPVGGDVRYGSRSLFWGSWLICRRAVRGRTHNDHYRSRTPSRSLPSRVAFTLHAGGHRLAEVCVPLVLLSCRLPPILPARATLRCGTADRTGGSPLSGIVAGDRGSCSAGGRPPCPTTNARRRWSRSGAWDHARLLARPTLACSLVLALLLRRLALCGVEVRLLGDSRARSPDEQGQCPYRQPCHGSLHP